MKKVLCILLAAMLALTLPGCGKGGDAIKSPVDFYYLREEVQFSYRAGDDVICAETREGVGHEADLAYLLPLYLQGPQDPTLRSPFPAGTKLLEAVQKDGTLTLRLSSQFAALEGIHLTLACACITTTCLQLTGARQVTIISDLTTVTMDRSSLTLLDDASPMETAPAQ